MSKYNLTDLAEGMGYKEYEDAEEANRLEKHPERDTIKKIQALMAKEKSLEEDAVDLAVEASQKKAGISEDEKTINRNAKEIQQYIDQKRKKAADLIDSEVADRIEGLTNRELKRKFLFAFEDLYSDLIEEDPFHAEDVINHLNNEMHKHLSSFQNTGDKFAGMEESSDSSTKKLTKQKKIMSEATLKDAIISILKDTNATNPEVQMYVDSLTKDIKLNGKEAYADYEIDDYIEDFKNYIADKSLQEHFKRFK